MIEAKTKDLSVEPGLEQPEIERFLAPFEAVARSLGHGSVNLPTLRQLLWQQRPLEEEGFFGDERRFRKNLRTVVARTREKGLIEVEYGLSRRNNRRLAPMYNGREIYKLGVAVYFWQKEIQATAMNSVSLGGIWERIITNCHSYSPDFFGPLPSPSREESLLEEPDLYLDMRAEDLRKRCLYFSLVTRGKENNWVDGLTLEGGRMSWEFTKKARWLYLGLQGETQVEGDNDINNNAFLQVLAYLKDYLEQKNCTFGEAITALHQ